MKIYYYALFTLLIFFGCSNNDKIEEVEKGAVVAFKANNISTRVASDKWEEGDKIGVFMYNDQQECLANNIEYANVNKLGEQAHFMVVNPEEELYYPPQKSVNFVAYYPYQEEATDYTCLLNVEDQSDYDALDMVFSTPIEGVSKEQNPIYFDFSHLMSKVVIDVVLSDKFPLEEEPPTEADIKPSIFNVYKDAKYHLLRREIYNAHRSDSLTFVQSNYKPEDVIGRYRIVLIPQLFYDKITFSFVVKGFRTFRGKLPASTIKFESGKRYYYKVILTDKTEVEISEATILDWESGNDGGEDKDVIET